MVKKNYIAPSANEARTKLRTTILAGSTPGIGAGTDPQNGGDTGVVGTGSSITDSGTIPGARQRSASSLD